MRHFFDTCGRLKKIVGRRPVALFLDFDGTLAPIAPTPAQARMSAEMRRLLEEFAQVPRCRLTIVSGRSLGDIRRKVGVRRVFYVGNHGLEIAGPGLRSKSLLPTGLESAMRKVRARLKKAVGGIQGVLLEDKGLTLSVHYRLVRPEDIASVRAGFVRATAPFLKAKEIRVTLGKRVFEVQPPLKWDKGEAVLWLWQQQKAGSGRKDLFPIYLGDDATDEDAFRALRGSGLGLLVGTSKSSQASYYLRSTHEVEEFLRLLLGLEICAQCLN
jgi:trehalose-phosphatase